jgi:uncharacterized protein YcaQ
LLGDYKFVGQNSICEYVKQAGCVQFDPIDVCGKNAELVFQSRVKDFNKQMLYDLLYKERKLIDYFDKNLAIMEMEDWKYFGRIRDKHRKEGRGHDEVDAVVDEIKEIIHNNGPVCSKDFDLGKRIDWYWSNDTKLSRVALETMYYRGDLVIHHKNGTNKYYALAEDFIPKSIFAAEEPYPRELEHMKWRVLRRISAVGMMWNKPSDAWLNIWNMKADERKQVFQELIQENKLIELTVENISEKLYCLKADEELIKEILNNIQYKERTEFLAPLDSMLWDRKLIKKLFDFDYKWEIYTPQIERKYGYYVLPVLHGDHFAGRIEIINERKKKCLVIKNFWLEDGVSMTKKLSSDLERCIHRFAAFNNCVDIQKDY